MPEPTATDDKTPKVAELIDITKHFVLRRSSVARQRREVHAVDGVSVEIPAGTTVGLVGETGSGKSTVARLLLRLTPPTSGTVVLEGQDITRLSGREMRPLRHKMQLVFQDPYSSFDPMSAVGNSIGEALKTHGTLDKRARSARIGELLEQTGLSSRLADRRPRELSGGQLQRAAVARALAVRPSMIALDEPVSSLDVSTQAQVINLLRDLQDELEVAYLFISHDLAVVRHISHRIAVMYLGKLVETGSADAVYQDPKHPYTQALLSAVPVPGVDPESRRTRTVLQGDIPSPLAPPSGCRFRTRCPSVMEICSQQDPPAATTADGTTVFCHLYTATSAAPGIGLTGPGDTERRGR